MALQNANASGSIFVYNYFLRIIFKDWVYSAKNIFATYCQKYSIKYCDSVTNVSIFKTFIFNILYPFIFANLN